MREAGISKSDNLIDMRQLEACIRSELDLTAQRRIAVLDPVKLVVDSYPADKTEYFDIANNPNREANDTTTRKVAFTRELWIENEDFAEVPPPKFKRLTVGGEVRLMGGYIVSARASRRTPTASIAVIHCTADLETGNGNPADGRKVKGTIHWVSAAHAVDAEVRLYDKLFTDSARAWGVQLGGGTGCRPAPAVPLPPPAAVRAGLERGGGAGGYAVFG